MPKSNTFPIYCHKVAFDPSLLEPILDKLEEHWSHRALTLDEKF